MAGRLVAEARRAESPRPRWCSSAAPRRWANSFRATSDGDGRFELRGLQPGPFVLYARRAGYPLFRRAVEVPAEPRRTDLGELALATGTSIAGQVTDARGAPLAEARVFAHSGEYDAFYWMMEEDEELRPDAKTGPDGRFQVVDLPRGAAVRLRVERDGYLPQEVPGVESPKEDLAVVLKPARGLSGRVVGPDGEPVADAAISWLQETRQAGGMSSSESPLGRTDEHGVFAVTGLEPGAADLRVQAEGYAARTMRGVPIPADRDASGVEIALARATLLKVRVLFPRGAR